MRIFAVGTKILGGGRLANIWGPVTPGPNVEPPLFIVVLDTFFRFACMKSATFKLIGLLRSEISHSGKMHCLRSFFTANAQNQQNP